MNELLDKYIEEFEQDVVLDRVSLEDKTMAVPSLKAKWLARLTRHKKDLKKYETLRDEAIGKIIKQKSKEEDIAFSPQTLEKMAYGDEIVKKITDTINAERSSIEFCDKVLQILSSMTYDIKNIIEWSKLELA